MIAAGTPRYEVRVTDAKMIVRERKTFAIKARALQHVKALNRSGLPEGSHPSLYRLPVSA